MAKIKICGIFRECDAEYINKTLPDYFGMVFYPKSHRCVSDELAIKLRRAIAPSVKSVGVFVDDDIEHIYSLCQLGAIDIVQLHAHENESYINELRSRINGIEIWKAYKINNEQDIALANSSTADMVVLDNGYGTGECFDWSCIGKINREFILAGGINTDNIVGAIQTYSPYAIDISSGVETNNVKDYNKIKTVVDIVHGGF